MMQMDAMADWAHGLDALMARLAPRFFRFEARRRALAYLKGLLAPLAAERYPGMLPMAGTPFGVLKHRFMSPLGIPFQAPPYGTISAIDLRTGALIWQVPMGTVWDTGPLGIRMDLPISIGMPTLGGPIVT